MNATKKNIKLTRKKILAIPMTNDEKEVLKEEANKLGMTMATFSRIILKDYLQKMENKKGKTNE